MTKLQNTHILIQKRVLISEWIGYPVRSLNIWTSDWNWIRKRVRNILMEQYSEAIVPYKVSEAIVP